MLSITVFFLSLLFTNIFCAVFFFNFSHTLLFHNIQDCIKCQFCVFFFQYFILPSAYWPRSFVLFYNYLDIHPLLWKTFDPVTQVSVSAYQWWLLFLMWVMVIAQLRIHYKKIWVTSKLAYYQLLTHPRIISLMLHDSLVLEVEHVCFWLSGRWIWRFFVPLKKINNMNISNTRNKLAIILIILMILSIL